MRIPYKSLEVHLNAFKPTTTMKDTQPTILPHVKVVIRLRQKQQIDISHWRCTLHGELRNVTSDVVELYCVNIEDAIHSFKVEEIRDFKITGSYPDDDYARGAPCPWIY